MDLSKVDIFGNETGTINTANCYVVRNEGDYCFPLVYGNAIKNGKDNKEAYKNNKPENALFFSYVDYKGRIITDPYIKDKIEKVGVIWENKGIELKKLEYKNNYLYFTLIKVKDKKRKQGENAVIGVYDEEGKVIWSWHIWYYEGELEIMPVRDKTKYKKVPKHLQHYILSINLGWNGKTNTFYQWGRKDPFRGDIEKISTREGNLYNSISNPDKLFSNHNFERYVNLWDSKCDGIIEDEQYPPNRLSIKTIYDPCPPGFKVPGCDVFEELGKMGSEWKNGGRMFGNRIFFPASGYRDHSSGSLYDVSNIGYYWSSVSYGSNYAYGLVFYSGKVYPVDFKYQTYGFSVRPFLE
jgi:hypothetical protein